MRRLFLLAGVVRILEAKDAAILVRVQAEASLGVLEATFGFVSMGPRPERVMLIQGL